MRNIITCIVFKQVAALSFSFFVVVAGQIVLAAPPDNDLRSQAVSVGVGFNASLDTSEATTDSDDTYLNGVSGCNFPATDASVWYQFVGTGETVRIEVFQSNYSASILIADRYSIFGCGIGGMDFVTLPGETYYMLVLDDQRDGGGNGGVLNMSITLAPPPPDQTVTLAINPFGTIDARTGIATISGNFICNNADSLSAFVEVDQANSPFIAGSAFTDIRIIGYCDGRVHAWSADLYPTGGRKIHAGRVKAIMAASSTGPYGGGSSYAEREIILRGH